MDADTQDLLHRKVREAMPWIIALRRDIHRHPELRFEEYRTAERLAEEMRDLGLEITTGLAGTGVTAVLEGEGSGGAEEIRTVGLRGDMDALPMSEATGLSFASERPGIMHACGHDAHSSVVAGVARIFATTPELCKAVRGRLKFLFQPAEEGGMGANEMIRAGALENPSVDAVLGFHVFPNLPTGQLSVYPRYSHASADSITLTIRGRGGHAGYPHHNVDPLVPMSEILLAFRTLVAREVDALDSAAISVGMVRAGETDNVIPAVAEIRGTLRCFGEELRERLHRRIREVVAGIVEAHRATAEVRFHGYCPANCNDARVTALVQEEAVGVVDASEILELPPSMGAEDFGFFTKAIPGSMFRLGCTAPTTKDWYPLHSPHFVIDEGCFEIAAEVLARTALRMLDSGIP